MGEYGKRFYVLCRNNGIEVACFIDNFSKDSYDGFKPIKAFNFFAKSENLYVVICNRLHFEKFYKDCLRNGVSTEDLFVFLPSDDATLSFIDLRKDMLNTFRKLFPLPSIKFETNLVYHCNLNCMGCDHFCPLAEQWFADINEYKRDMRRMSGIFDGEAGIIRLIGGEPLLHPDVTCFMEVARENFKRTQIDLLTNGLLLPKESDEFWDYCKQLDIGLDITQYPVMPNFDALEEKARRYGLRWHLKREEKEVKTLFKIPLNPKGNCDPMDSYLRCLYPHNCHISSSTTLKQGGRLYSCTVAAHINIFNKYFGHEIGEFKRDYINIHAEDVSDEKILEFLSKPIPMCRYCDNGNAIYGKAWGPSKKEINEWC
jgi:MoaA/NifB/PqqE/SkfB family radical SAM enzyme